MRAALDTNVLVYADVSDQSAQMHRARELVGRLRPSEVAYSVLALGELFHVLVRKAGWPREQAKAAMERWRDLGQVSALNLETLAQAAELAARHKLAIWDAAQIVCAAESGCEMLLTEDLQDGFEWGPVLVANPFLESRWQWLKLQLHD